ncbi:unnamed protein product [Kuraishia capsulata CBS 1993]|uniref:Phosphoacetylglucosamine mutase n=1 Tax=Kuraishia capsulata CBS 1993 TaxID=1382522 RepID=W6MQ04_9ASCO|nr:uncharacterized protein KUCA_T00004789001 [Kuraishia capsulata CBS 1993]CDK28804.1 unnamed protein product [Kuraishia capsulata CBS 1993]
MNIEHITGYASKHLGPENETFAYGTAGFRMLASKLDPVVFRVGILAGLRSKALGGKTIGVMITASHNPPKDNGIKIVDPFGEMLEQSWEAISTKLANSHDSESLISTIKEIVESQKIDWSAPSNVVVARDSRESGPKLLASTIDGLKAIGASFKDFGQLTTPQLHYLTRCFNDSSFGKPDEEGYYEKLILSYSKIMELWGVTDDISITVDAANGIGADQILKLQKYFEQHVKFTLVNGSSDVPSALNSDCGADFVKTNQKLPSGIPDFEPLKLYSSFDGDADRVVFYYLNKEGTFRLLDGDKIATLLASFISSLLSKLDGKSFKLGIVQTAYANGSSSNYITNVLKLPLGVTATGVKHLHHKAQSYDIGVYFEANGHGTVLFSDNFVEALEAQDFTPGTEQYKAASTLRLLVDLINQTVGDSIADLLAVLVALRLGDSKTPEEWDSNYTDLPNRLLKALVKDRNQFKTTDAERKLVEPVGLQSEIDEIVAEYPGGRSFVRASGTEDAVRIYAEANTIEDTNELASRVSKLLEKY